MGKTKKPAKKIIKKVKKPARSRKVLAKKSEKIKSRKITRIKKSVLRKETLGIKKNKKSVKKVKTKKIKKPKKIVVKAKVAKKPIVKKKAVKKTVKKIKRASLRSFKKNIKHSVKKTQQKPQIAEFPAETLFKARIKVIGIGGGGGSIVSEIGRSLEKATFVVADTDIRALKKRNGIKYLWFGQDLTHGLGTGVNVDLAKQAAEEAKDKISEIFKEQDIVIFIASLGGGLGSGATQVFAEAAREFGGITFGIFTMPFRFEGKNKYRIAQNALKSLRQSLNVSLVIPNEKIFKIIDANTAITEAFSIVNKSLIESLESLIDLIYNPGIINIDFADLRTILKGRGNTAFLNTVEESGKNRAEKICEKVLSNPLLQSSNFEAEKILFNIAGSDNLSMFEVEKVSSHISNLNPKAKIIFGISKNSKLKNKIKTTILMTGGQMKEDVFVEKAEPVKVLIAKHAEKSAEKEPAVIKKVKELASIEVAKLEKKENIKRETKKTRQPKPKKTAKENKGKKSGKKSEASNGLSNKPVSFIPVFEAPLSGQSSGLPIVEQRRMAIVDASLDSNKKTIRRSGLEIKKAEEREEKKRLAQEKEWEIPAFLRRVKFNK